MASFFTNFSEALQAYHNDGFFIEEDGFNQGECAKLVAESQSFNSFIDGSLLPEMNVHLNYESFWDIARSARILCPLASILNGEPQIIQSQFYFTPPNRKGLALHQDNFYVEADNNSFASVWIPLVNTNKDNGGLFAYPNLHKKGILPTEKIVNSLDEKERRQAIAEQTSVPNGAKCVDISLKAGGLLFLHGCNPHGSYTNKTNKNRPVILFTYVKQGTDFRAGQTARRAAKSLF